MNISMAEVCSNSTSWSLMFQYALILPQHCGSNGSVLGVRTQSVASRSEHPNSGRLPGLCSRLPNGIFWRIQIHSRSLTNDMDPVESAAPHGKAALFASSS